MKVGILTFHEVPNYGAVLQAYALQRVISEMGYDCQIINYRNDYFKQIYKPVTRNDLKYKKFFIKKVLLTPKTVSRKKKITLFVEKNINLSKSYDKNSIGEADGDYDTFIVGSDQVWNLEINGHDETYFLDFVKTQAKKNSYAASFTMTAFTDIEERQYRRLIRDFNHISIREYDGKEILSQLLKRDVEVVIDPTLVLPQEKWKEMVAAIGEKPYLLVYLMSPSDKILQYAKRYAKEKKLKIKYISLYEPFGKSGMDVISDASVEEWISLIYNAEYVIANSFHGIVFSIIFEKNFMYAKLKDEGKNTRISSLLNTLQISNREINPDDVDYMFTEIDYKKVNGIIECERSCSLTYIKKVLE
jgi:hypothetical protein